MCRLERMYHELIGVSIPFRNGNRAGALGGVGADAVGRATVSRATSISPSAPGGAASALTWPPARQAAWLGAMPAEGAARPADCGDPARGGRRDDAETRVAGPAQAHDPPSLRVPPSLVVRGWWSGIEN